LALFAAPRLLAPCAAVVRSPPFASFHITALARDPFADGVALGRAQGKTARRIFTTPIHRQSMTTKSAPRYRRDSNDPPATTDHFY
jgi:hypothetical protein